MAEKNELQMAVYKGLNEKIDAQIAAIPEGFNKERFVQNCMTVLTEGNTDYSKCDPNSLVRTLMKGAFLNLDFFNGECYAIAYGGKVQFQTDYKGEVKVCKRFASNPIKDIYAKVVREGDMFEEVITNGEQSVNFKPIPFNDGEIIGAFAVCLYKDGSMIYDTMSKEQIEQTRKNYSKQSTGQAWTKSYGEMCKKTVLRRLCKLIDLNFDTAEAMSAFDDGGAFDIKGKEKQEVHEAVDVMADVVEAEVVDVEVVDETE